MHTFFIPRVGVTSLSFGVKSVVETSRNSEAILKVAGSWKSSEITWSDESRDGTRQSVLYDSIALSFHPCSRVPVTRRSAFVHSPNLTECPGNTTKMMVAS